MVVGREVARACDDAGFDKGNGVRFDIAPGQLASLLACYKQREHMLDALGSSCLGVGDSEERV